MAVGLNLRVSIWDENNHLPGLLFFFDGFGLGVHPEFPTSRCLTSDSQTITWSWTWLLLTRSLRASEAKSCIGLGGWFGGLVGWLGWVG